MGVNVTQLFTLLILLSFLYRLTEIRGTHHIAIPVYSVLI